MQRLMEQLRKLQHRHSQERRARSNRISIIIFCLN